MATNPNNAVGTNAAYGGRTSVNAFNDDLAVYESRGVLSGWACAPSQGMTVVLGGSGNTRDVAIAEDNSGNRVTINNISGSPVAVTIGAAPAANSRIDCIVAYVDNPPQGSSTIVDNYEACGLISVAGTASSSPVAPNDGAIRSAITADGASGATAYYVVLATITVPTGITNITSNLIAQGSLAAVEIPDGSITADKIDFATLAYGSSRYVDNQTIPAGVSTTVLFPNNIVTDTEAIQYNNGVFTVKKSGWWMISAQSGGSGSMVTVSIFINNEEYKVSRGFGNSGIGNIAYTENTTCVKLNANDTINIQVYCPDQIELNRRVRGNVDICLVCPTNN